MATNWGTLVLLFMITSTVVSTYPEYFVEDRCLLRNDQITYYLGIRDESSAIILKATRHPPYKPLMNCTVLLKPLIFDGDGVVLTIRKIDFGFSLALNCRDYIRIYLGKYTADTICNDVMDNLELSSFENSKSISFLYHTEKSSFTPSWSIGFEVIATAYKTSETSLCRSDEFYCDNGKCVWSGLKCDGHNNCGDNSDESFNACGNDSGYTAGSGLPNFVKILIAVISSIVLLVFITILCCHCCGKRKEVVSGVIITSSSDLFSVSTVHPVVCPPPYLANQDPSLHSPQNSFAVPQSGFSNPLYSSQTGISSSPPPPYSPPMPTTGGPGQTEQRY